MNQASPPKAEDRYTPPRPDELEVSVIGPGKGECIILHLGNNDWCVIDSCIAPGSTEPVAIEYLRGLGMGKELNGVKMVIATHWHDDHIRGLESIFRLAPSAKFCCSMALENDNFAQLVETTADLIQERSGVNEFKKIFDLLQLRANGVPKHLIAPKFALENTKLLHLQDAGRCCAASVTALSPSSGTIRRALSDFATWLPKPGDSQRSIPNISPNRMSVVLWVEVGTRRVLLGADLEHTSHSGEGWLAVLSCHQDSARGNIFKVPHHGSENADCPEVWSQMLAAKPIAIVTPFRGGVSLPKGTDLQRISKRTDRLYCTALGPGKPPPRDNLVEKTMRRVVRERSVIQGRPGHVRIRWSLIDEGAAATIHMFDPAFKYADN